MKGSVGKGPQGGRKEGRLSKLFSDLHTHKINKYKYINKCIQGEKTEIKGKRTRAETYKQQQKPPKFQNHDDSGHRFLGFQICRPKAEAENGKRERGNLPARTWLTVDHSKAA